MSPQDALSLFDTVSRAVFPLFAGVLQNKPPVLKVRLMKTRWGVCMPAKRQITLNLRLAEKPIAAVEYVMIHEYAHFLQPNHSAAFWAIVARLMPDYKARQALLKNDFL
ncbi:MAG: M48 family metallopeptidase [Ruthenibacterium sp.]